MNFHEEAKEKVKESSLNILYLIVFLIQYIEDHTQPCVADVFWNVLITTGRLYKSQAFYPY